ncbi:Arm DNA-binding domain-containing protein [Roseibium sp. Sym1]|uniref:Arm DNA-binding domain-containing protein n=1 Tax=Roseibium sp. Sym1 TaxID=3016006 RepID=UPI0022B3275F|nr:aldehyde dehydrogenase family protein [Roseibium sp. Sym1]
MALSDFACKSAKAKEKPYRLSDGDGLYLLVQKNGSKLWAKGNHAKAEVLSKRLHAGMVGVNTFMIAHAETPFGGVDHSGMGREGGRDAVKDYRNTRLSHIMAG